MFVCCCVQQNLAIRSYTPSAAVACMCRYQSCNYLQFEENVIITKRSSGDLKTNSSALVGKVGQLGGDDARASGRANTPQLSGASVGAVEAQAEVVDLEPVLRPPACLRQAPIKVSLNAALVCSARQLHLPLSSPDSLAGGRRELHKSIEISFCSL